MIGVIHRFNCIAQHHSMSYKNGGQSEASGCVLLTWYARLSLQLRGKKFYNRYMAISHCLHNVFLEFRHAVAAAWVRTYWSRVLPSLQLWVYWVDNRRITRVYGILVISHNAALVLSYFIYIRADCKHYNKCFVFAAAVLLACCKTTVLMCMHNQ